MKKKFLRMLTGILACTLLSLCFVACGGGENTENNEQKPNVEQGADNSNGNEQPEKNSYTITWVDENGGTLASTSVAEGEKPSYFYEKTDTAEWDYTVLGWSLTANGEILSALPNADNHQTYYAIVSKVKRTYTLSFNMQGGESTPSQTVEYGGIAKQPETPKYEGYKFMGWYTDADGKNAVDWNKTITGNTVYYAVWNKKVDIGEYLKELLQSYQANPYEYIPESMTSEASAHLISTEQANQTYSSFVNVSNIPVGGFGEQWNMVLTNLKQSATFFSVLNTVEGLTTSSLATFNNYLDKNPADTARHSFASGIYSITIDFNGETIDYVLDYTANIPLFGEQTVQIALQMDIQTKDKTVRIQIGEANALRYILSENSYEFAIQYLGVRRAYFSIEKTDEGVINGHICEYLTVSGVQIQSSADFYIDENYVSAVGNKADGMVGFTGYISELYTVFDGKLVGYEVQETLSSITYNTVWVEISALQGVNSIKYKEGVSNQEESAFFVNGSSKAWESKKVGGFSLKALSRRFDIEFRTQYFYTYDNTTNEYSCVALKVPMLFVQEENYDTLTSDVASTNNINVSVQIENADLTRLLKDYDELLPLFIENKQAITVDIILEKIGEKIIFE